MQKRCIESIKQKVQKIVENRLKKNCGEAPIVPMFGMAVFPDESATGFDLEKIARDNIGKMFES
jgi:hypothetical protein